jgi:hypothetical protein
VTVAIQSFTSTGLTRLSGTSAPQAVEAVTGQGFPAVLVWRIVLDEAQPAATITLRITRSDRGLKGVRGNAASAHVFTFGLAGGPDIQAGTYVMAVPLRREIHGFGSLPAESFFMAETEISEGPATLADCSLTLWRWNPPR